MTTAAPPSVDWVRLTIGDDVFTLAPPLGIELCLTVGPVEREELPLFRENDNYRDPLAMWPEEWHVAVDLIPSGLKAIVRCEAQAREVAARLGAGEPASVPLREFSLEAALGGEGLPYNRMMVPRLLLVPGDPPVLDEDRPVPSVRVFTAKVPAGSENVYTLTRSG